MHQLAYLLVALPFVADRLKSGQWPPSVLILAIDAVMSGAILSFILLWRRSRSREIRIDGLRKTMNEAIIHDLKNPMTSIMGCLSCVINDSPDAALQRKLLELALHSCRSQMTLLETLVDTSRIEHGELIARKKLIPLRELLDGILDDTRGAAAHLGVNLKEAIAPDLPDTLHADAELLSRILSNLIHNALKYTSAGGDVSLAIDFHDGSFHFNVMDTGIGIPAQYIKKLFEKYYRVEGSDQSTRRGSGLGLYFCRLAVEAHGGNIQVHSKTGSGTTIAFSIPRIPKEEHAS